MPTKVIIVYEKELRPLTLAFDRILTEQGFEVLTDYKLDPEIVAAAGWVLAIDAFLFEAHAGISIRTEASFRSGDYRGIREEWGMIKTIGLPMYDTIAEPLQSLSAAEFHQMVMTDTIPWLEENAIPPEQRRT